MISPEQAIVVSMALPTIVGVLVALLHNHEKLRDAVMVGLAFTVFPIVVGGLWPAVTAGQRPRVDVLEMFPGLSLSFEVEPLGLLFAMVASGLWPITAIYGLGYLRGHHDHHQTRFFTFFSAAISAALGIAYAGNLLTLFVFYELLTFSTFPLVTHYQDDVAKRAGRIYLGILVGTSVCFLLLAIVWTYVATGTLDFRPGGILKGHVGGWPLGVLLGLYAFGIGKSGLMPFHRWLPNAMVAPTPVSALLHAVAVVKAGVFSVLKVVVYVFGLELLAETGLSVWLMYVASFTIIASSIVALTKDNLKERLAYSTIGQLAYIILGAALANGPGVLGGSMHIAMHAFGKITLFFCAGAIYIATHLKNISDMRGLGRYMPWTYAAFLVGSFSVIGLPPFGGVWSKWFIGMGAAEAGQPLLVAVLMVSSLLNIAYLMPVVVEGFFHEPSEQMKAAGFKEASTLTLLPPLVTAAACLVLFFYGGFLYDLLLPYAQIDPDHAHIAGL